MCGRRTTVYDTRQTRVWVRRRRECVACGARFTTIETPLIRVPRRTSARPDSGTMSEPGKPRE